LSGSLSDLFGAPDPPLPAGMRLLRGFAEPETLAPIVAALAKAAPFRFMTTRGGGRLAAAMTSCGDCGWVTDRRGYRYEGRDPETGQPWPPMPEPMRSLAVAAAKEAGYPGYAPDTCLINRYEIGAGMGLHQDSDEAEFTAPVVSVSLGLPATFLVGGASRTTKPMPLSLVSGDVLVFGGPARLFFHGIRPVKAEHDARFGPFRYNLTFRRARA
jgi:alkylated DNA repair protein (DNA oxidative demethylase)